MKILILVSALALSGCCNGGLNSNSVAYRVGTCNSAQLDYEIIYNAKGKPVDVICYKPGHNPRDTNNTLEYVQ